MENNVNWRTVEHLNSMVFIANLIRFLLHQPLLTAMTCNVTRTPMQLYRNIKKKRIHKVWAVKRKWTKRHGTYRFKRKAIEHRQKEIMDMFMNMLSVTEQVMKEKRELAGR